MTRHVYRYSLKVRYINFSPTEPLTQPLLFPVELYANARATRWRCLASSLIGYCTVVDLEYSVRIKYQMNSTFVVGCSKVKLGVHTHPMTGVTKTCTYSVVRCRKSKRTPKGVRAEFMKTHNSVDDDIPRSLNTLIQSFQAVRHEACARNTSPYKCLQVPDPMQRYRQLLFMAKTLEPLDKVTIP